MLRFFKGVFYTLVIFSLLTWLFYIIGLPQSFMSIACLISFIFAYFIYHYRNKWSDKKIPKSKKYLLRLSSFIILITTTRVTSGYTNVTSAETNDSPTFSSQPLQIDIVNSEVNSKEKMSITEQCKIFKDVKEDGKFILKNFLKDYYNKKERRNTLLEKADYKKLSEYKIKNINPLISDYDAKYMSVLSGVLIPDYPVLAAASQYKVRINQMVNEMVYLVRDKKDKKLTTQHKEMLDFFAQQINSYDEEVKEFCE